MRSLRPITLVVFDSHLMCLEGLTAALDDDPTVAIVATTTDRGALADIVARRQPDICLVDVAVADSASIGAVGDLAQSAPRTAVVAIVDDLPGALVRRAVAGGVRGFARKDLNLRALRRVIERVAGTRMVVGADTVTATVPDVPRHTRTNTTSSTHMLTDREHQVLDRMMAGDDTRHIAAELRISRSTARTHVQNVRHKLGAHTKLQAVALAVGTAAAWVGNT